MRQTKTMKLDGFLVVWNGYTIEYVLPPGTGGMQLQEFVYKNEKAIAKFRERCEK